MREASVNYYDLFKLDEEESNETAIVCKCSHLTFFGVLFSPGGDNTMSAQQYVLLT